MACLLASSLLQAQQQEAAKNAARQYIQFFASGQYDALVAAEDSVMKRKADKDMLEGLWMGLEANQGKYMELLETRVSKHEENYITVNVIKFEKRKIGFQLSLNQQLKIVGIFLVPADEKHQPAPYVRMEKFYEIKISIPHNRYPAQGVLSLPKSNGKVPVVIIVPGSGGVDKDCSIGPNKVYKDLAWGIAAGGVAVFRYDKRTFLHQPQMLLDNKNGKQPFDVRSEYLEDVKAIVELLRKRKEIDPSQVYIMGHSEGGYLIPLFNQQVKHLAGFISLAGTLRQIPELALEQFDYLTPDSLSDKDRQQFQQLKQMATNSLAQNISRNMADSLVMMPFPVNYWLYLKNYHPQQLALKMQVPLLVLQGERDYQVKMKDVELWKTTLSHKPQVSFITYPKLNHLFLEGEGPSTPAEYMNAGNVPAVVVNDVLTWVKQQANTKR